MPNAQDDLVAVLQMSALLARRGEVISAEALSGDAAAIADRLKGELVSRGIPLPPPAHLQRRVVGTYVPQFVLVGDQTIRDFNAVLSRESKTFADFQQILDFGCGCGRLLRSVSEAYPKAALTGIDIDKEAIDWLATSYVQFGRFVVAPHAPPAPIDDATFDLVYGVSVFTHLPERMQFEWLAELRRITKPGAFLLLTVHGENYLKMFPEEKQKGAYQRGGFLYNDDAGITDGLPDFYKNSYHTESYIRSRWSKHLEIVSYTPLGLENYQDIVLCRWS
jgi:SAM-dependent methyltransferase